MDDNTPKTLNRAGFLRRLGTGGKPVRSDAGHQRWYGERMSSADGEQAQVEFIVLREVFRWEACRGSMPMRWPSCCSGLVTWQTNSP